MEEIQHPRPTAERRRSREDRLPIGPGACGESEETADGADGTAQVVWGAIAEDHEVVGMTAGEVREIFQGPYNIAPQVEVLLNGARADAEVRLAAGDVLEFVRAAGEKGVAACP
jgi:hypothetical protein